MKKNEKQNKDSLSDSIMSFEVVRQINMARFNHLRGEYENHPILQVEGVYSRASTAEAQIKRLQENEELNSQAPNMSYFIRQA